MCHIISRGLVGSSGTSGSRKSRSHLIMGNLPTETPPENTGGQKGHHRDHLEHGFLLLSRDPIS